MNHPIESGLPRISSIFLPTDFSPESHTAFAHALRFAVGARAKLNMMHVRSKEESLDWIDFPHVRETLENWSLLPTSSRREDLWKELGFDAQKVICAAENPVRACLEFLENEPADLIVLATHHSGDEHHWFGKRIAEPLAKRAGELTLFLPAGRPGFVSLSEGEVELTRILIPIDGHPAPQHAVDAAVRTVRTLGALHGVFTLFHCGTDRSAPSVHTPEVDGWTWDLQVSEGHPAQAIATLADSLKADLVVMASEGRHGFLDAFRGSTSERVLHHIHCPLAVIPAPHL